MIQIFMSALPSLNFFKSLERVRDHRRYWLFYLALNWAIGILFLIALAILSHVLSYWNLWTWLWAPVRAIEPPVWVFWLGEAGTWPLVFCFFLGFFPAFISGRGGWMWVLAPAFLFPGILSLPGAWVLIFSERLGLWCRSLLKYQKVKETRDLLLRVGLSCSFIVILVCVAPALRGLIQALLPADGFNPDLRFLQAGVGLIFLITCEQILSFLTFHFYYFYDRVWSS